MTKYLTGAMPRRPATRMRLLSHPDVGVLVTPDSHLEHELDSFEWAGADNGCYGLALRGETFSAEYGERFLAWADTLPRTLAFVAIPDVLRVVEVDGELVPFGDAAATLELFPLYAERVRAMGHRVALVLQDGMTSEMLAPLWAELDAVFVGGSDEFKLGETAAALCREAKGRGLWVHVGRVNSAKRHRHAAANMGPADSVDGTFLAFGPDKNTDRLLTAPLPSGKARTRWLTPESELDAIEPTLRLAA